ncbi:hypothetical protein CBF90_02030 [Microbacterium sp. AISO3]|uniref:hypothetical protein n=1 Tax=Microbacterium sp. AISO3 TaxID=2002831 RepID=UPI000B4C8A59|nr:hypothetical protein [Microbacterium sp. AISO3]OWP20319.1 hypothetical protein CBF90_17215 [Microbacterium sp. AISO3]OWP23528.1 hypothetical protein CBF90_02030 [Microbacterium sp. AISO3]
MYPHAIKLTDAQADVLAVELRASGNGDKTGAQPDEFIGGASRETCHRVADNIERDHELRLTDQLEHEEIATLFWARDWNNRPASETLRPIRNQVIMPA